jgi:extracellular elastinolytic metalloproteinase
MSRSIEGGSPVMKMGLWESTGRHTAFDASVVFHEFTHGVTNRLVGGGMNENNLDYPQSRGLNEGNSDFIACSILDIEVLGDWVTGQPGGIRGFRYDSDFPDHFGKLGSGRYQGPAPHPIGELWCAALMELSRNIGRVLSLQLLVDGLKLAPANPSFLDLRDAILLALEHAGAAGKLTPAAQADARRGFWAAFAKFGMGPKASSWGASLMGIVTDFEEPAGGEGPRRSGRSRGGAPAGRPRPHPGKE